MKAKIFSPRALLSFFLLLSVFCVFSFAPKAFAVNNPALSGACGLNVILVLDSSTSMAPADIATAKDAATELVNALQPSSPTKIGVIDFNTGIQGTSLPPTTDKASVLAKINTYVNHPNGASTNWQAALQAADGMSGGGDLVVIITDGNPNYPVDEATALNNAVTAADSIKANGSRIMAIGINSSGTQGGLDQGNLVAISGSKVKTFPGQTINNINDVDVAIGDISALSGALDDISTALCGGTISLSAQTPYNVAPGATVPFAYTVSVSKATAVCRLLDFNQAPVNGGAGAGAYGTANPINWAVPLPAGTYSYYVQCRNAQFTNVVAISNQIIVNVIPPPRPDLTALPPTPNTAIPAVLQAYFATIQNVGNAATGTGPFNYFYQTATAPNGGGTITNYTTSQMPALAAGASGSARSPNLSFPVPGTYSIRVCADKTSPTSPGGITESDETNNCSGWADVAVGFPPVPVVTISAAPTSGIVNIVKPTITWSTTNNPTSCTASGDWSGAKAVGGGSQTFAGALNTVRVYTFTLVCSNPGGASVPVSANVVVNPPPASATATLMSNPSPAMIVLGQSVLLTWTSTNATSCSGTGFNTGGATQNSTGVPVTPPVLPTTYTLTCFNSIGQPSAPSSITVTQVKKKPIYTEP